MPPAARKPREPKTQAQKLKTAYKPDPDKASYVAPPEAELDAIREILEDESYADLNAMARAVHKKAFDLVRGRTWWTAHRGGFIFEGLEPSEVAIRNFIAKNYVAGDHALIAQIIGPGVIESARVKRDEDAAASEFAVGFARGWPGYECPECGHSGGMHTRPFVKSPKAADTNSPGPCLGPGKVYGPSVMAELGKSYNVCGCKFAIRRQDEAA